MARNTNVAVNVSEITAIADALKAKTNSSTTFTPLQFAQAILSISNPSGYITISDTNLTDVEDYETAIIEVSNLRSTNIKSGITILGVSGDSNVINASGGTATSNEIAYQETAYTNNTAITGTGRIYVSGTTAYIPEGWIN